MFDLVVAGVAIFIVLASIVLADVIITLLDKFLEPFLKHTKTTLDDKMFLSARGPLKLYMVLLGTYFAVNYLWPNATLLNKNVDDWLVIALIIASAHLVSSISKGLLDWYAFEKDATAEEVKKRIHLRKDVFPMARRIISLLIYLAALIIVLNRLGIEITPLLTGLGIAGLAVALALQGMLSNFFAGVYLLTDKPIKSGDFISIDSEDSKTKGFVEEIGWRTTKLRTLSNYIHLIPNDKLAQSVIINFTGTKESKPVSVSVGVCYECDSELVEKTLNSCAQAVIKKWEDADRDFVPIVRTTNFLDSAVEFTVIIAAKNPWNTNAVAADLRKEILFQFKKNKIEIPYPKRVLVKEYSN